MKFPTIRRLTIYIEPMHWQLWPLYEGGQWAYVKKIIVGPLVIRWEVPDPAERTGA